MMRHHSLHHQSDSDLIAYVHQQLTAAQRESIDQHLEECLDCLFDFLMILISQIS